jgi:hypothetical protein
VEPREVPVSESTGEGQDSIRMSPEEEQAALESSASEEAVEPADEGVGAHTDSQQDDRYTEN